MRLLWALGWPLRLVLKMGHSNVALRIVCIVVMIKVAFWGMGCSSCDDDELEVADAGVDQVDVAELADAAPAAPADANCDQDQDVVPIECVVVPGGPNP